MAKSKRRLPKPSVRHIRLRPIPEPKPNTRSVLVYTGKGTVVMRGPGNVTMDCGRCGSPLAVGIKTTQVMGIVFKCNNCGAFNETVL